MKQLWNKFIKSFGDAKARIKENKLAYQRRLVVNYDFELCNYTCRQVERWFGSEMSVWWHKEIVEYMRARYPYDKHHAFFHGPLPFHQLPFVSVTQQRKEFIEHMRQKYA